MKLLLVFLTAINLFAYSASELKEIITSNSPKIDEILHSKEGIYLLEEAVWLDRMDILKKVKKDELSAVDIQGDNLLMFAAFLAKPKFVKFLLPYINPNQTNKRRLNSLQMVFAGLLQVNGKKFQKDKKLQKDVFEVIKILKQNYAKFEYPGDKFYTGRILYLLPKQPPLIQKLLLALMNDKQKMFAYVMLNKENKAKEILNKHIEFLKEPYFLDYPKHFLWILANAKKYEFAKYMLDVAKKNNINLIDYMVTSRWAKNADDIEDEKFWKFAQKYIKPLGKYQKTDYDKLTQIPFDAVFGKDYKTLDDFTKYKFWNFVKYKDEVDTKLTFDYYTPFLLAIELKDKKAVDIMLKNGGYMSGWNELHYRILTNKPLNLDKYPKWERIYKVNQGELLDGITPITLALMYNPKYLDELLKYMDTSNMNIYDFHFAIKDNLEDKFLPYVRIAFSDDLILLAKKKRFDIIKKLYKKGIINEDSLRVIGKEIEKNKELLGSMLNAYLLKECKENEDFLVYPKIDKEDVLKCLKAGYKFSDDTLVALIQDGDKEIMKYLVKYKNHKIRGKYYPLFFITKKEFLDEFTTPKSRSQRAAAECTITFNKDICKKAVKTAIELKNYNFAANVAIKTNQPYLVKDYVDKLFNMFKMCYYLETNPKKADEFSKKTKAKCPYKIKNRRFQGD
jgi:hypothetical protein